MHTARASERIEDLRVAWERDLERDLLRLDFATQPAEEDPGRHEPRVRLEPSMAARVHEIARDAAERLGFDEPFEIYQTRTHRRTANAQALLGQQPFAIRLIGPVAALLDDAALRALIGHELGHALALGARADPPSRVLSFAERDTPPHTARLCVIAAELTAERFAVLAAGEIEALVRLEVADATYDAPQALGLRELAYLEETCRRVERNETRLFTSSYPTAAARLYADWLFWQSDAFRELTGRGSGELALRDVDERLRQLCDAAARAEPVEPRAAPRAPSPKASPRAPSPKASPRAPSPKASPGPTEASAGLADWFRSAATSARAAGRSFVSAVDALSNTAQVLPKEPDLREELAAIDDLDETEQRFRALEAEARRPGDPPRAPISADLEARFRLLESEQDDKPR